MVKSHRRIDSNPKSCPPPGFVPPIWAPCHSTTMQWLLLLEGGGPQGPWTCQSNDTVMLECDGGGPVHVTIGCPLSGFVAIVYCWFNVQQSGCFPFNWMFVIVSPFWSGSHVEGRHPWEVPAAAMSIGDALGKSTGVREQDPEVPPAWLASKTWSSFKAAKPMTSNLSTWLPQQSISLLWSLMGNVSMSPIRPASADQSLSRFPEVEHT